MSASVETVEISRCRACQARYPPTDSPCPRCGSLDSQLYLSPAIGVVVASTELIHPPSGWESPHGLALVELPESVRLLAIVEGALPALGAIVAVRRDGEIFRARSEPSGPVRPERGEGESPRVGSTAPSFEPPR